MLQGNFTERLARASARRRWLVLGAWLLAVLASAAAIGGLRRHLPLERRVAGRHPEIIAQWPGG